MGRDKSIGIAALVGSTFIYSTYGIITRLISDTFGAFSQNYYREIFSIALMVVFFGIYRNLWKKYERKDLVWIIVFALAGSSIMVFLYVSFNLLTLATTYFLYYSSMIITGYFLSWLLFKERIVGPKLLSLPLVCIGIGILYKFEVSANTMFPVATALVAGVLTGIYNVTSKKISGIYHPLQLYLPTSVFAFVIAIFGALLIREPLPHVSVTDTGTLWNTLSAAIALLSNTLIYIGFRKLPASLASTLLPLEAIFAAIFGLFIYHETLSSAIFVSGACIIIAAGLPDLISYFSKHENSNSNRSN
ncbi:hypothetical protein CO112_02180 [Candidatus Dojkabacteria bacterium CG_4_9_14_3_um_filter_150_Dojkabacteria_WS6_41_13]|uniref:EamA domain-containing protein n=1 Tax=Candidatus Dojkabacteria bacterium CG_4_10_14_0_2_um_filter_Dojkabacteria_WS6_41_15 TaxID=2014249 RepID=A0A2M7W2X1_9BACT|nr:MAG: hypothetical protein COZ14_04305 [Candidatus Dojkabacteria bacterium CG_4_10_14_3_um_filter_Dojkabacteria_WS6_41_9]PJA15401.1 MAG: hypothetical protein COX64_00815 [Candidatus Dojkabacteria bacterium CG_4_10_14_0_2_um_filter_Dojkabacteria_WS6_41_15]PJB22856.1 MAG: hypothetical protein CO112_02180 [Candidatus Dojkabacteria bacterium CG_4_9_14_3_um_filter_150_Dojkabacteria_WS6_41_13]